MLLMLLFIVTLLLFIPVLVVDADEGAAEGEDFAKSDEDGVMDLCQWWADEARYEQCAPKRAHCNSGDELEVFHRIWKLDRSFHSLLDRSYLAYARTIFSLHSLSDR